MSYIEWLMSLPPHTTIGCLGCVPLICPYEVFFSREAKPGIIESPGRCLLLSGIGPRPWRRSKWRIIGITIVEPFFRRKPRKEVAIDRKEALRGRGFKKARAEYEESQPYLRHLQRSSKLSHQRTVWGDGLWGLYPVPEVPGLCLWWYHQTPSLHLAREPVMPCVSHTMSSPTWGIIWDGR